MPNDQRNNLQQMFQDSHRFANFGDVIIKMRIKGFRCHSDTTIEVQSPITAFCGLNGTGKSTLLQLAATAYASPSNATRKYIKDFIIAGKLDRNAFTDIVTLCRDICGVNFSIGYYNEHSTEECINVREWIHTYNKINLVLQSPNLQRFEL